MSLEAVYGVRKWHIDQCFSTAMSRVSDREVAGSHRLWIGKHRYSLSRVPGEEQLCVGGSGAIQRDGVGPEDSWGYLRHAVQRNTLLAATELLLFRARHRIEYPDNFIICVQGSLGMSWWLAVASENINACVRLTIHTVCQYGSETHCSYWHTTFHNKSFVYWLLFATSFNLPEVGKRASL